MHRIKTGDWIMTNTDVKNLTIAKVVDARGNTCPGPLLEAKKGIGQVKIGEVLEIKSSDPGTRNDIPAWARKVGHDYLGLLEAEEHDRLFVARKK
jgi:tRNA 2-thiouridine synthesizing protein A